MMVRRKHIRRLTDKLLSRFGIEDAPVPVETIAKSLGAVVHFATASDDLSGFLYRNHKNQTAVIGVNVNHHRNRQLFTIAHELGHFLLHDADDVHVDRNFDVKLRNSASSKGTDTEEKEANLFAAELLMPETLLRSDLQEIEAVDLIEESVLASLAKRYGVSTQAMTFRLGYLGYVQL
jgi:Zn-dependent peptidase ImmA (M78 family)